MKKLMIGMAAAALALGGALPAAAGNLDIEETEGSSIWDVVASPDFQHLSSDTEDVADLILIAGMATMLDTCGNGKPFYTFFPPMDSWGGSGILDVLDATIAELQASPAVVRGILNDHLVNGSFSPWQLQVDAITTLTARSGFTLRIEYENTTYYVNDQEFYVHTYQACNGWVYPIEGFIDSTPQVPTEGLNSLDTPTDGTPGGSNSLPDTL